MVRPCGPVGIGSNYIHRWKAYHKKKLDSVVWVFDTPNAMPRYYKDNIYNVHQRLQVVAKAIEFSATNEKPVCPVEHDKLIKKLNRKHR